MESPPTTRRGRMSVRSCLSAVAPNHGPPGRHLRGHRASSDSRCAPSAVVSQGEQATAEEMGILDEGGKDFARQRLHNGRVLEERLKGSTRCLSDRALFRRRGPTLAAAVATTHPDVRTGQWITAESAVRLSRGCRRSRCHRPPSFSPAPLQTTSAASDAALILSSPARACASSSADAWAMNRDQEAWP
jgi:hypothetical protein